MLSTLSSRVRQRAPQVCRALGTYVGHDGMTNYSWIDPPAKPTRSISQDEAYLGSNLLIKWYEGVKQYGWQRTIVQAYTMGDIKFGELVGEDENGNLYFENVNYPYGQHRWVEYKDIHNLDSSSIPPAWHGWMHHMSDAPGPDSSKFLEDRLDEANPVGDDSQVGTMVGHSDFAGAKVMNKTIYRQRGYKIGGTNMLPGDKNQHYVHVGHAGNKKSQGRFEKKSGRIEWAPENDEPSELQLRARSLDLN